MLRTVCSTDIHRHGSCTAQNKWDFSLDWKEPSDEELRMSIGSLFQAATEECLKPRKAKTVIVLIDV